MFEYNVVTERGRGFSGAFDPDMLEALVNRYAADGWRLAEGFMVANVWKSVKTEIMLILERAPGESGGT
jgi:hypothetical protein